MCSNKVAYTIEDRNHYQFKDMLPTTIGNPDKLTFLIMRTTPTLRGFGSVVQGNHLSSTGTGSEQKFPLQIKTTDTKRVTPDNYTGSITVTLNY